MNGSGSKLFFENNLHPEHDPQRAKCSVPSEPVESANAVCASKPISTQRSMLRSNTIAREDTEEHQELYIALTNRNVMGASELRSWSSVRIWLFQIVHSDIFELVIDATILFNLCIIVYQVDYQAQCYPYYKDRLGDCPYSQDSIQWTQNINLVLLCWYTLEGFVRLYTDRLLYFKSTWNRFDGLIVMINWAGEIAGTSVKLSFLRFLRLVRLVRAFRVLLRCRELLLLIHGVMSSMRAILYGSIMLFMMLLVHSIILVEWLHPYNSQISYFGCAECTHAFQSVWRSVLTLFKELIAGQAWIMSFPLIEQHSLIAPFMIFIVVTTNLGVMNLILAVIVERAAEAHAKDLADAAQQKIKEQRNAKSTLLSMCAEMDKDDSKTLTQTELRQAFRESEAFRNMLTLLEVQEDDIEMIFNILDKDGSGDLDYEEFCNELVQLESHDTRLMLALMRLKLTDTCVTVRNVEANLQKLLVANHEYLSDIRNKLDQISSDGPRLGAHNTGVFDKIGSVNPGVQASQPYNIADEPPDKGLAGLLEEQHVEGLFVSKDLEYIETDLGSLANLTRDLVGMSKELFAEVFEHSRCLGRYEACTSYSNRNSNASDDFIQDNSADQLRHLMAALKSLRRNVSEQLQTLADSVSISGATMAPNFRLPDSENECCFSTPWVPAELHASKLPCCFKSSNTTISV